MQSLEISTSDSSSQTFGQAPSAAVPVTAGWLVRRMALWMLLVGLGVAASCLLYMAASNAETESVQRSKNGAHKMAHTDNT